MENIKDELPLLLSIMSGITGQFGDKCEVVLHDLTQDYESTIIAIMNGHVTGRKVGDCGSNLGLEVLRGTVEQGDKFNYVTQTRDGKILRSTSIYLKNSQGKTIGSICINLDISDFLAAEQTIKSITMHSLDQEVNEVFVNDVNDLLDYLINECQKEAGKPISLMSKEEKIKAIDYLDIKGAFLVKKSGDKVCQRFDISKFTLYSYLEEVRTKRKEKEEKGNLI
ncbi:helix-turn-helix transcriptional regulator [Domibacillus indicus]|uniref:helix-turn-helix transcriptional regulator n=1 Tax=Domibacillus indicus TaxID=1437523 RepID=UPI0006182552|nr:helix-turn-helix transcriptional regulator [Domibacillus indicus]